MGVVTLNGFRTQPGRLSDHLAATTEAHGHLTRLGMRAAVLQCVSGGDVGVTTTILNFESHAAHAAGIAKIGADEQWQEFWLRAADGGSALQVESSIMADVDPAYQPPADRPFGVIFALQWQAKPGRLVDFMGHVIEALPHIERLGGTPRVMQSMVGTHPMTTMVSTSFADLDAYGAYTDAVATDTEFQAFWAGVMSDPTADVVRSGLYLNASPE